MPVRLLHECGIVTFAAALQNADRPVLAVRVSQKSYIARVFTEGLLQTLHGSILHLHVCIRGGAVKCHCIDIHLSGGLYTWKSSRYVERLLCHIHINNTATAANVQWMLTSGTSSQSAADTFICDNRALKTIQDVL